MQDPNATTQVNHEGSEQGKDGDYNIGIHNYGTVKHQNVLFEPVKLEHILTSPNEEYFSKARWERCYQLYDQDELKASLLSLHEKQVVFIACDHPRQSRPLAHYISSHSSFKATNTRELHFENDDDKQKEFGINDVIRKFGDQEKDLFILADLSSYVYNKRQRRFLHSLTQQLHTDNMKRLRKKRIFFAVLISNGTARDIREKPEEHKQHFHIWDFNGLDDKQDNVPDPNTFFDKLNYIEQVMFYTATFFPGLSPRSFDTVVQLLLSNTLSKAAIVIKRYKEDNDGARLIDQLSKDTHVQIWRTNKGTFSKNCYLSYRNEGRMRIIDFRYSKLREHSRKYFMESEYGFWQEHFEIIDKSPLLFEADERLAENVISLMMDALVDNQEYYDEQWFWLQAQKITRFKDVETDIGNMPLQEAFFLISATLRGKGEYTRLFHDRLGQMLGNMLSRKWLGKVDSILHTILKNDKDLLLNLIQRLKDVAAFDHFYWLKLLFDEVKDQKIENAAYRWLLVTALYQPDVDHTWRAIKSWITERSPTHPLPASCCTAYLFILEYYVRQISIFPVKDSGKWPSVYPLFSQWTEAKDTRETKIIDLLQTLFQQDMIKLFSRKKVVHFITSLLLLQESADHQEIIDFVKLMVADHITGFCYETVVADMMEAWFHILHGFGDDYNDAAKDMNAFLFETLKNEAINRSGFINRMLKHWDKKAGIYDNVLHHAEAYIQEHMNTMNTTIQHAFQLFIDSVYKRKANMEHFLTAVNHHF